MKETDLVTKLASNSGGKALGIFFMVFALINVIIATLCCKSYLYQIQYIICFAIFWTVGSILFFSYRTIRPMAKEIVELGRPPGQTSTINFWE